MCRLPCILWLFVLITITGQSEPQNRQKPAASSSAAPHVSTAQQRLSGEATSASSVRASADTAPKEEIDLLVRRELRPFIERFCLKCHGEVKPKGNLSLASWRDSSSLAAAPQSLSAVLSRLSEGSMPPEEEAQPTESQRQAAIHLLKKIQLQGQTHPGRVTLRRLNRVEYNNTVRDLLGVDLQPADDFPGDDVGYGFDSIGDVLTMSPLLMEKYLKAAERIVQEGLTPPPPPQPQVQRVLPREFTAMPPSRRFTEGGRFRVMEQGELTATVQIEQKGIYRIRVQATAELAGDQPPRLTLYLGEKKLTTFSLESAKAQVYRAETNLEAGKLAIRLVFENPFKVMPTEQPTQTTPATPDQSPATVTPVPTVRRVGVAYFEIEGPHGLPAPPPPPAYVKLFSHRPGGDVTPREAARRIIEPLAMRAYRRPVAAAEVERLLQLFDRSQAEHESFEDSVRLMVQGLLVSPHFLFRAELHSHPAGPDREELDSFALASRLSYFLWSSMPDEELFQLAQKDRLRDPETLAAQCLRLLRNPKASALTANFAGQWLQLRSLARFSPDPARFPNFDDELRQAMVRETELFFEHMLREGRPVVEFLTADYTFLNERLARHYGISGVQGAHFRRVQLSTPQRGGLLTHGSVLAVTSNPTRTSPVKRGKWILENLLAAATPPPPPGAGDLAEDELASQSGSLRQRMEKHRRDPNCASCHARLDPLGFALENYDAIGRWRTHDGQFAIDATGTLPDGRTFAGVAELKSILADRADDLRRCLAEKLLTYALGRGCEPTDRLYLMQIVETGKRQGDRLQDYIIAVVQSEPFRYRLSQKR